MKRKKQSESLSNAYLPLELVAEVLARLPVKSLVRFRIVCKSWHSLISSHDFASLHLARFHKDNDDDENTPVLTYSFRGRVDRWMIRSSHTFKKITSKFSRNLDNNNSEFPSGFYPCGNSVNGLVVLLRRCETAESEIMLWNPMLGKTHKLPTLGIGEPSLGLGFSLSNNDYKVVAISKYRDPSVHLYSLNTGTWKSIVNYRTEIVHDVHWKWNGVLIEGTIFWATNTYSEEGSLLVSFDVNNEVFGYIEMPPIDSVVYGRHPVAYRKWVGLVEFHQSSCNLWVMEKDQVPGTWSKLYTVDLEPRGGPSMICFKKNGQLMFASRLDGMDLCSFETQQITRLMKSYSYCCPMSPHVLFRCTLYKESLLLL